MYLYNKNEVISYLYSDCDTRIFFSSFRKLKDKKERFFKRVIM